MTEEDLKIFESPAIISHLEMLQNIISRLANNGAACKTWCVTLLTSIVALSLAKDNLKVPVAIGFIPIGAFWVLDAFYLSLERTFRNIQKEFLAKITSNSLDKTDLFAFPIKRNLFIHIYHALKGMCAFSNFTIYLPLTAIIMLISLR